MTTPKKKISNIHITKVQAFVNNKIEVQKFIQSWLYRQDLSLEGNLGVLAQKLTEYFGLDTFSKRILQDYLIEPNIPIQVTLRPLRPSHLVNILEQWIEYNIICEESSDEKKKSSIIRNQLFNQEVGIQTEQVKKQDLQVQASESVLSFMDIVNSTIAKLNAVTAETSSQRDLKAIQRIQYFLRNEKMALLKRQVQNKLIQKESNCDEKQDQLTRFSTKDHKKLQIKCTDQFNTFTPKHSKSIKQTNYRKLSKESYSPKLYMTQLGTRTYRKQYNPYNF